MAIAPGSALGFRFAAHVEQTGINCGRLSNVDVQSGCDPFVQARQRGDIDLCIGCEPVETMAIQQSPALIQTAPDCSTSRALGAELGMVGATQPAVDSKREALRRLHGGGATPAVMTAPAGALLPEASAIPGRGAAPGPATAARRQPVVNPGRGRLGGRGSAARRRNG